MATQTHGGGRDSADPELLSSPPRLATREDSPLNDYLRPIRIGTFAPWVARSVAVTGGVPVLLASASPLRVGLLLSIDASPNVTGYVGPLGPDGVHPVLWVPGQAMSGGSLAELLSLMMSEWWISCPVDCTAYVTEFTRPI